VRNVVVTNFNLPVVSGIELLQQLRQERPPVGRRRRGVGVQGAGALRGGVGSPH
jgi:CheY-like chemotaxis protein